MKIKNIIIVLSSLMFSLTLIFVSAFQVCRSQVQAQIGVDQLEESVEPTESGEEKMEEEKVEVMTDKGEVDYYLPYPGILPDHPLYWLKMVRDKFMLMLARAPESRFERLLLYADKRIGASKALIEGGKTQLGVTTATKGEKYLEQAVDEFKKIAEQTPELKDRLMRAVSKHEELLTKFVDKVPDQAKTVIESTLETTRQSRERLDQD